MIEHDSEFSTTSPWFTESRLGSISEEDSEVIHQLGGKIFYPKGSYIFYDGDIVDSFYYIEDGLVRCFIANEDGYEKNMYFVDMFVGIECFLHNQPIHCNWVAEKDTTIYCVSGRYKSRIMECESIRNMVMQALALKCRILGFQIVDYSISKPLQRVARILYCWCSDPNFDRSRSLLHQDIADVTGLHRVTVTNCLSDLKKKGIIQPQNKCWVINDMRALKAIAFEDTL